jgi:hypothetical protein
MTDGTTTGQARQVTFRDVFAVREFRALWTAQLLSIAGDQFARIGLAVLVYDRTRSSWLAAVTLATTVIPPFAGGLLLGWTADAYPRRTVMVTCDLVCTALVLLMVIPGMPLAALIVLLSCVSLLFTPFQEARMTTNMAALDGEEHPDRYRAGNAVTVATYQLGQLAGLGTGGLVVAAAGVRGSLLIDAASFASSAVIVRVWVRWREPADDRPRGPASPGLADGVRAVFGNPVARVAVPLAWLVTFAVAAEGVTLPLARTLAGRLPVPATAGLLLGAATLGGFAGYLIFARFVRGPAALRVTGLLPVAALAVLALFALQPGLPGALVILAVSGLFMCYINSSATATMRAIPDRDRGKAGGVIDAGMYLGQGGMILAAGAAAARIAPATVIALVAVAGACCAIPLAVAWQRLLPSLLDPEPAASPAQDPAPEPAGTPSA